MSFDNAYGCHRQERQLFRNPDTSSNTYDISGDESGMVLVDFLCYGRGVKMSCVEGESYPYSFVMRLLICPKFGWNAIGSFSCVMEGSCIHIKTVTWSGRCNRNHLAWQWRSQPRIMLHISNQENDIFYWYSSQNNFSWAPHEWIV